MNIKLANKHKITIQNSRDIYQVMQRILKREQKIDRNREHLWTISLDNSLKILNIELVSMGSFKATIVEPMEVFSVPLQKRAVSLILVHNHPSGSLLPTEGDSDLTDRLIQVGIIMDVPVIDHLIITESSYYSFKNSGLLDELEKSIKYVPAYKLKERFEKEALEKGIEKGIKKGERNKAKEVSKVKKEADKKIELVKEEAAKYVKQTEIKAKEEGIQKGEKNKATEMAKVMLKEGMQQEIIIKITGLSEAEINKLK